MARVLPTTTPGRRGGERREACLSGVVGHKGVLAGAQLLADTVAVLQEAGNAGKVWWEAGWGTGQAQERQSQAARSTPAACVHPPGRWSARRR
jgi:hypothetical protein